MMIANPFGIAAEMPRPTTMRAATNRCAVGARAQASVPTPKITVPIKKMRRCPRPSPRRPITGVVTLITRNSPVTAHDSTASVEFRSSAIVGRDADTMVIDEENTSTHDNTVPSTRRSSRSSIDEPTAGDPSIPVT